MSISTSSLCLHGISASLQVCSILWSTTYKEFISGHGFAQNQLVIWKYPTMAKVTELRGKLSSLSGEERAEGRSKPQFE